MFETSQRARPPAASLFPPGPGARSVTTRSSTTLRRRCCCVSRVPIAVTRFMRVFIAYHPFIHSNHRFRCCSFRSGLGHEHPAQPQRGQGHQGLTIPCERSGEAPRLGREGPEQRDAGARQQGGAIVLPKNIHQQTRTYGWRGRITKQQDSGRPFRDVLATDIRDLRRIAGNKYDASIRKLIEYYEISFPNLINK